jgi:hypothetical protein
MQEVAEAIARAYARVRVWFLARYWAIAAILYRWFVESRIHWENKKTAWLTWLIIRICRVAATSGNPARLLAYYNGVYCNMLVQSYLDISPHPSFDGLVQWLRDAGLYNDSVHILTIRTLTREYQLDIHERTQNGVRYPFGELRLIQ